MAALLHLTTIKKRRVFLGKFAPLFSFFMLSSFLLAAQSVSEVFTDFGGYWRSNTTTPNPAFPNTSHNVLAFKVGTSTFSTGVNNSLLTSKGVTYTAGTYKALPITSITGTITVGSPIYIALAGNYDGNPSGYSNPLPGVNMQDVLTDGINGLDIGTGTTNIPATATMTFPVESIDAASISDVKPDILYSQIADPTTTGALDVLYFTNSSGVRVGNTVTVDWGTVSSLGTYTLDLYNLTTGATCDEAVITSGFATNTTRKIRLTAFKLSDFGITAANETSVAHLIVKPGGESDLAFVAYNSDAFIIAPPTITTQPQTQVVCAGANQSATFSVVATGTNDTYQWRKNGVNIAGANGTSYTVNPVTSASAGAYDVVVTNGGGTVTSNKAYLNTSITQQPLSQTIVTGNSVTLSVSATNASSYQWKRNGTNITGATSSTYTINPVITTNGGSFTVSAINSANACATVLSSAAVITPAIIVYSKGTGNINIPATWGANTDGSGSTPVDFTRTEHTFVLSNRAGASTLTDLTIAGTLDVKNGIATITDNTTLDVGWAIRTGSGSISGSTTAALTVRGNSNLYFTAGSQVLKDFTVRGGTVNMLSPLTISGGPVLPGTLNLIGGTLALGTNKITLTSTSLTNTSMVTTVGAGVNITYGTGGAFVVERFIPGKRAFRFISPAVTTTTSIKTNWMEGVNNTSRWVNINPIPGYGTHITGSSTPVDSVDATQTFNPSLYTFDNFAQKWNYIANSSSTLTAGKPYRLMVRGSRSVDLNDNEATPSNTILRTTGALKTGSVTLGSGSLSSAIGANNFVGNPYAAPINWLTLTKTGLSTSYYAWDPSINRRGSYVTYNGSAFTNSNAASDMDENIQSEQGFFVETRAANPTLQFQESNKTGNNTRAFRGAGEDGASMAKLSVQLMLNNRGGSENAADGLVAVFSENFSKGIGEEDSYKFGNLDENMAINRDGTALSIEGRPNVIVSDTLPLKLWQYRQNSYVFKVEGKNFSPLLNASIKDEFLKKETPISLSSSTLVAFDVTSDPASSAADRFSIIFESYAILPVVLKDVKAYQKDKGIQVEWNVSTETNVAFYEVEKSTNGQHFENIAKVSSKGNSTVEQQYNWLDEIASSGANYYRIKITDKTGEVKYSSVVKVNISNANSSISVFPNPVKGREIGLQLSNLKKGKYAVNIYNNIGQKVFVNSINHKGGSASQTVVLPKTLSAGKYTLQVSNDEVTLNQTLIVL